MATDRLWCVRAGESGVFANDFRTGGYVAIGWNEVGKDGPVDDTAALIKVMERVYPDKELGTLQVWAAQVRRFYREPQIGDGVVTYDPKTRTYHLGVIDSDVELGLIRFGGHLSYGGYDVQTDARHCEATPASPVHRRV